MKKPATRYKFQRDANYDVWAMLRKSRQQVHAPDLSQVLNSDNCGTGAGGFKPGNSCATGGTPPAAQRLLDMLTRAGHPVHLSGLKAKMPSLTTEQAKAALTQLHKQKLIKLDKDGYLTTTQPSAPAPAMVPPSRQSTPLPTDDKPKTPAPQPKPTTPVSDIPPREVVRKWTDVTEVTDRERSRVADAFNRLNENRFNLVNLVKLREETGYSVSALHKIVDTLVRQGVLTTSGAEGRFKLTPEEREVMMRTPGQTDALYVSVRSGKESDLDRLAGRHVRNVDWEAVGKNCGIGKLGFMPGNKCGKEDGNAGAEGSSKPERVKASEAGSAEAMTKWDRSKDSGAKSKTAKGVAIARKYKLNPAIVDLAEAAGQMVEKADWSGARKKYLSGLDHVEKESRAAKLNRKVRAGLKLMKTWFGLMADWVKTKMGKLVGNWEPVMNAVHQGGVWDPVINARGSKDSGKDNCGTGKGGFKKGNTCAIGDSESDKSSDTKDKSKGKGKKQESARDVYGRTGIDPAANRPSKPEERHLGKDGKPISPPSLKEKYVPPKPQNRSKAPKNEKGQPITGYAANGISATYIGDLTENAMSQLDFRNILPLTKDGKEARSHKAGDVKKHGSSLDREFDHSGHLFEVKTVCIEGSEYKAKPKAEEMEDKRRFAEKHKGTGNTCIVVLETDKLQADVYWRAEIGAPGLNPDKLDGWNYAGRVFLDKELVEDRRKKTEENYKRNQELKKAKEAKKSK